MSAAKHAAVAKHEAASTPATEDELLGRSLLQRIILPRPGEPLDVRTLYLEESLEAIVKTTMDALHATEQS